ncbi:MAG: SLC13 family permease [Acidobacteriota bacterium]
MSFEAILLLTFLIAALASFLLELLPVDVTALGLVLALMVTGIVPVNEALVGFSNKGVLTIGGLFILSHSLIRTGLVELAGERLSRRFRHRKWLGIGVLLAVVAVISGFLNNTAVVAMTIPLAVDISRRIEINPSKVLMPLSFAAIFGGTLTLIGTSTNLLVSSLLEENGQEPLSMFQFTPMAVVFLAVGLIYVLVLAPRFLPERTKIETLTSEFEMDDFLTELEILEDTKLVGQTALEAQLSERYDVTVLTVIRGNQRISVNLRTVPFEVGDLLLVRGGPSNLLRLRNETGVALLSDVKLDDAELSESQQVVEALVSPNSSLIGRTLQQADFRHSYGAFVLAIRRAESTLRERLARTRLRFADTLLIVVSPDRLGELRRHHDLIVTTEVDVKLRRERLWWLPIALVPSVILLAATGLVDLVVAVLAAIVVLLVLKVIRPQESYRAVEWRVIVFIAAFIPVGDAMLRTGLADKLANAVLAPTALVPQAIAPWVAVSVLYLVTSVATETVTNSAAAIVLTPVALGMASQLDVRPEALVIAICFAASASFMTPTGYQTNMMVYGAGNYRFTDFSRFGGPLNLLFWILASALLPVFFPFH